MFFIITTWVGWGGDTRSIHFKSNGAQTFSHCRYEGSKQHRSEDLHHLSSSLFYFHRPLHLQPPSSSHLVLISGTAGILQSDPDSPGCPLAPTCCLPCNTSRTMTELIHLIVIIIVIYYSNVMDTLTQRSLSTWEDTLLSLSPPADSEPFPPRILPPPPLPLAHHLASCPSSQMMSSCSLMGQTDS